MCLPRYDNIRLGCRAIFSKGKNIIFNTMNAKEILANFQNGVTEFSGLDVVGSLEGENLEGITFEQCSMLINFKGANLKGAKFKDGSIKNGNFTDADLTDAHFENMVIDKATFKGANTNGLYFRNNSFEGSPISQDNFEFRLRLA